MQFVVGTSFKSASVYIEQRFFNCLLDYLVGHWSGWSSVVPKYAIYCSKGRLLSDSTSFGAFS